MDPAAQALRVSNCAHIFETNDWIITATALPIVIVADGDALNAMLGTAFVKVEQGLTFRGSISVEHALP